MTSAPPTPLRPLCRTRRRSSSLSTLARDADSTCSSSPDQGHPAPAWSQYRSPSRPDGKRAKRTRIGYGGESSPKPPSPLKQTQRALCPPPEEELDLSLWTHPAPFAAAPSLVAPASAHPFSNPAASTTAASLFCASATAFALPGLDASTSRLQRSRNASAESAFFPSHASLSSSKGSFDDSSFASDSPPQSLPSASTSPDSLDSSALLAAVAATSATGLPIAPPPLRRASSCNSPMLCDGGVDLATPMCRAEEFGEAERLHHVAFEQLRAATREEEEDFIERMRRWEAERGDPVVPDGSQAAMDDIEFGDDEDEIEVTLELGPASLHTHAPAVTRSELDELTRRLQAGACELEDYSLVREVQARSRSRSAGTRA